jgi:type III secretion protein S
MASAAVIESCHQALMLVLLLSLPAVLTSGVVGLLSAIAQAVTQVQDQSVSQALRLISVLVALALSAKWMAAGVFHMADQLFVSIGFGGGGVQ